MNLHIEAFVDLALKKPITAHDDNWQIEFKLNRIFVNENK